jgi:hypothetical protein
MIEELDHSIWEMATNFSASLQRKNILGQHSISKINKKGVHVQAARNGWHTREYSTMKLSHFVN